jgi:hypothetical protein
VYTKDRRAKRAGPYAYVASLHFTIVIIRSHHSSILYIILSVH